MNGCHPRSFSKSHTTNAFSHSSCFLSCLYLSVPVFTCSVLQMQVNASANVPLKKKKGMESERVPRLVSPSDGSIDFCFPNLEQLPLGSRRLMGLNCFNLSQGQRDRSLCLTLLCSHVVCRQCVGRQEGGVFSPWMVPSISM